MEKKKNPVKKNRFLYKVKELWSVGITKRTKLFLIGAIFFINVLFVLIASAVLIRLSGNAGMSFPESAYYIITMILDAGCIENAVAQTSNPAVPVVCICFILLGTLSFTGAFIGFITNVISDIIDSVVQGKRRMYSSGHTVILNWNTRASEIVNDLLFKQEPEKVIVLVPEGKEDVQKEVEERLIDTVRRERAAVREQSRAMRLLPRLVYRIRHRFRNRLTVIVREGDVFSTKQLEDISLKYAKSVIILGNDGNSMPCRFAQAERSEILQKGNSLTVKTLMQVAEMTAAADSNDDQTIVVEITDEWTKGLVGRIIKAKESHKDGERPAKNNIVPVDVNKILGQILAQFSLMPELNAVYSELFSNKGAAFYCAPATGSEETVQEYFDTHCRAIPLNILKVKDKKYRYFVAEEHRDGTALCRENCEPVSVELNPYYSNGVKTVIILGHNSKMKELMEGFESFKREWSDNTTELKITVIDDEESLKKMDYYRGHPFVTTYAADIYEKDRISDKIREIVSGNETDTSVLILSDDSVAREDVDAGALTNLVYLHDIILEKIAEAEKTGRPFDTESIDVIVEIIDPKHHDVVRSYSKNNVVISNRYISKMITQISESFELYEFYQDILSYDELQADRDNTDYESYEVYLKDVTRFFKKIPEKCTAAQLIRAVYKASVDPDVFENQKNPTFVLGYVRAYEGMTLFTGDQNDIEVELHPRDKLIVYSLH